MSWEIVAIVIGALVVLVESGVLAKLYKESKEFVDVLRQALADRRITAEEFEQILDEFDDIPAVLTEIYKLLRRK